MTSTTEAAVPPVASRAPMARLGSANTIGVVLGPATVGWLAGRGLSPALYAAPGLGMVLGPWLGTLPYRQSPALPYLLVGAGLWGLALFSFLRLQRTSASP